jgi:phosphoglycerate dehydrogenase-like enzyme
MIKPKVLVTPSRSLLRSISTLDAEDALSAFANIVRNEKDEQFTSSELLDAVVDVDGIITSWGSPKVTKEVLGRARKLKIIGHAAGSVKPYVCDEVFARGIVVISAAPEIAYSVAEYALAQILNCLRELPDYVRLMKDGAEQQFKRDHYDRGSCKDLTGKKVGLVGSGNVARRLIQLLKPFDVEIRVYDPYLSEAEALTLNVKKSSLDEVLASSDIISLHAAVTPESRHMIRKRELELIPDGAVFLNCARGALVDEAALISELRKGRFRAALDTAGEETGGIPVEGDLRKLGNVYLTPGLAGPSGERRQRLFGAVVEDFRLFFMGKEPRNRVRGEVLPRLA